MSLVQDPSGAPAANTVDAVAPVFAGKNALAVAVATIGLPTGAATAANQATEITSLQLLDDVPAGMNAAFNKATPIAGQLDDAATTAATEDNVAPVRITAQRAVHVNLRNVAGTEAGTAGAPIRTDPTGTTTQPISAVSLPLPTGAATAALQTQPGVDIGDVTVNNAAGAAAVNIQDGGNSITVDATTLPLPTGAATEATLATRLADATFTTRINTLGQKVMAASTPVVIASDQSTLPISAVSLPLPAGAATAALQTQPGVDVGDVTVNNAAGAAAVNIQDGGNSITVDTPQLPGALVGGRLDNNIGAWLGSTTPTVGQKTMAASIPVAFASDQTALPIQGAKSNNAVAPGATNLGVLPALANAATPTWTEGNQVALSTTLAGALRTRETATASAAATTSVAASAASVQLLAANTARVSASVRNDSTSIMYLKYGTAASATSHKVRLISNAYFEFPWPVYTGVVHAIWVAATGDARISEET